MQAWGVWYHNHRCAKLLHSWLLIFLRGLPLWMEAEPLRVSKWGISYWISLLPGCKVYSEPHRDHTNTVHTGLLHDLGRIGSERLMGTPKSSPSITDIHFCKGSHCTKAHSCLRQDTRFEMDVFLHLQQLQTRKSAVRTQLNGGLSTTRNRNDACSYSCGSADAIQLSINENWFVPHEWTSMRWRHSWNWCGRKTATLLSQ